MEKQHQKNRKNIVLRVCAGVRLVLYFPPTEPSK